MILLAALPLLFCACAKSTPKAAETNVFHIGNRSEVQDLNPHLCSGVAEFRALGALFEAYCVLDPRTMQPRPGAAATWTLSADGRVFTFDLQPNGKWSDGTPVTAEDFVYSWQRMLTPALGGEYAYLLHCLKNGKAYNEGKLSDFSQVGVKALSPLKLEVALESPVPYFLSMQGESISPGTPCPAMSSRNSPPWPSAAPRGPARRTMSATAPSRRPPGAPTRSLRPCAIPTTGTPRTLSPTA